jgi:YVTN family beta-propeller protein
VADPKRHLLFAANRGTGSAPGSVAVFDTSTHQLRTRIPVEVNPYGLALSQDGRRLYVSNWASASVSVVDASSFKVISTLRTGANPNDLALSRDGRLFVACASDNSISVIDTKTGAAIERISTALTPNSPEGATPNALALGSDGRRLFVANADNNDVEVVSIAVRGKSEVLGFIPTGWYPTAVATASGGTLLVGNSKGLGSYPDPHGMNSPLNLPGDPERSLRSLRQGAIGIVSIADLEKQLPKWTEQVYSNTPYQDELLVRAKAPASESVVPRDVGAGSPIHHVIYILKENRTYDQVFGDIARGNGDPELVLFGRDVTPNQHALAEQFVLFDNLYADAEVSATGHSWSTGAYATDFAEKRWPIVYSGRGNTALSRAYVPAAGYLWDQCRRKGLTYRSYGEYGTQVSGGSQIGDSPGAEGLNGHFAPGYRKRGMRDTDNAALFLREFDNYDKNFESPDRDQRLPNFVVMSLPEDHTRGTRPGEFTPIASVANNDYALGLIVERITNSRYWPETAIFVIEDDAQDGPDHVDARRTVALAISPYIKRATVDSTQYSTSSMIRTMELLLGLPPMSQFDAAATPMYASFGTEKDLTPFHHLPPTVDVNARNAVTAYGAKLSMKMDLDDIDEAPMFAFNEILWKSIKGANSPMPPPVHRYRFTAIR